MATSDPPRLEHVAYELAAVDEWSRINKNVLDTNIFMVVCKQCKQGKHWKQGKHCKQFWAVRVPYNLLLALYW